MDELCPLCLKMGLNRRIKAVQCNLEEAVWMCENEACPWPFLHEPPIFFSRKVGEKWAYEWDIYKKVQKDLGPIPVSTELSLYTPPVTPSSDAASKEVMKSAYASETNISGLGNIDNALTSTSTLNDSYAPKTILHDDSSNLVTNEVVKVCDENRRTMILQESKDTPLTSRKKSLVPSIFDIDGDEVFCNKISIKENSQETKIPNLSKVSADVPDMKNSRIDENPNAVLEKPSENKFPPIKIVRRRKESMVSGVQNETLSRPKIRSISRANVDLKAIDPEKITPTYKVDTPMKIETTSYSESTTSTSEQSSSENRDDASSQCTTTITVDGNLPITLSYNIGDLADKSIDAKPVLLSSIRVEPTRDCSKTFTKLATGVNNTTTDLSMKVPKKETRLEAKRRATTSSGKQYEKFNFSALKKFVRDTKSANNELEIICDSSKRNVINEGVKFQPMADIKSKTEIRYTMNSPPPLVAISDPDISKRGIEALTSINLDSNTTAMSDEASAETLNLSSVLDDILIEGYQNANENLNDDWLESFFT